MARGRGTRHRPAAGQLVLLLALVSLPCGAAPSLVERVTRDTEWLAGFRSRVVGDPAHDQAMDALLDRVRAAPGARVWTDTFTTVVPRTQQAELHVLAGEPGGTHRVYPLWPSGARLNTTPLEGLEGRPIYIGDGRPRSIPARSLRGEIAVMELSGGTGWRAAYNAGARAILLLGSPRENHLDASGHLSLLPLEIPRFYIPDGPLADALRGGAVRRGLLRVRAEWVESRARNVYALVQPATQSAPLRAIAIAVACDSMSIAPELAPGADAAVDTAFALALLEELTARPPARPVLFAFLDAYAIEMRGVREMLAAMGSPPRERDQQLKELRTLSEEYDEHEQLAVEIDAQDDPLDRLGEGRYRRLHRYIKDEVAREVVQIETWLYPLRIEVAQATGERQAALQARIDALSLQRGQFFSAQQQLVTRAPVSQSGRTLAEEVWRRARERIAGQQAEAQAELARERERRELEREVRQALGLPAGSHDPLDYLVGIDLSDAGTAAGPLLYCSYLLGHKTHVAREFNTWLAEVRRNESAQLWPGRNALAVDTAPLGGLEDQVSFFTTPQDAIAAPAESFGVPGVTWATLDGMRLRVDTPYDTADRLDWERLAPQVESTFALLLRLVRHTDFTVSWRPAPRWNRLWGTIVDTSPGEPVPRVPMHRYLTTLCPGFPQSVSTQPSVGGMRRLEFTFTGIDGRFVFDALPSYVADVVGRRTVQSYLVAEDGSFARAIDTAKSAKGVTLMTDWRDLYCTPVRAVVFTCEQVTGVNYFDPRFLLSLPAGTVMDTRRGGPPQRINYLLWHGQMTCLLEPDTRWQMVLRAGTTRNRFVLVNAMNPDEARGLSVRETLRGFEVGKPLPLQPAHLAARDFFHLDERRVRDYRRAGITSRAIDNLRARTAGLLAQADAALDRDDGAALYRAANGALSNEVRAYHAIRDTANDVIRAAIFLLLGLVPFSFVMERLLVGTPHVYRQLAGLACVFFLMTAILWSFHPAFRISNQPLMIVMAFGIIFMSLLVMSVVYGKFESGLVEMRSGRTESSGAETRRGGVLSSAFALGIANMRRRKTRTLLTALTVVVITFTLLCFTSTSSYIDQRELELSIDARYPGVLIRQPSYRPMAPQALEHLEQIVWATRTVVPRFWWTNMDSPDWRLHVRNPASGKSIPMHAALGLAAGEDQLTGVGRVLPDWARFSRGGGMYLARSRAEELGAAPGDEVLVAGRPLVLIGTFDAGRFDELMMDLDGESLLPADYTNVDADQRNIYRSEDVNLLSAELETGSGLQAVLEVPRLNSAAVAIVPATMFVGIRDYRLRSAAVRTVSHAEGAQLAAELGKHLAFPIYYGAEKGVRALAATVPLPQAPTAIFIPLAIGGLIIFNTLLGSIAERRREIHIFTSMGLAPLHVGALFLAEGLTYGLMGAIFGYIGGQGLASALSHLGLMGGITLNYSGTHAIQTMALVLVVVTLASLFPAYMAGKLAVPSSNMTWRVPEPVDDLISDTLPFTVTQLTANGVVNFLYEYMEVHREGSIGNFSTDNLNAFPVEIDGRTLLGIESTVWLAPYDLGVRQHVRLLVHPTDLEDVYDLYIELRRESGQVRNWQKLNRVFLGDLRRQLLGWRKLKLERMMRYIAESAGLLTRPAPAK